MLFKPLWLTPIKGCPLPLQLNCGFIIYADCQVNYDGRAKSELLRGHYLIIYKIDGSISIHAGDQIPPRNYQGSKSKLTTTDNQIIVKCKNESLTIIIYEVIEYFEMKNWAIHKLSIVRTERELKEKLLNNWSSYISGDFNNFYIEHITDVGVIDLIGVTNDDIYHIIEVKRGTAVINSCSQLRRYLEYYVIDLNKKVVGYVASPKISRNAHKYLLNNGCKWLEINF